MKKYLLSALAIAVIASVAFTAYATKNAPYKEVNAAELQTMLQSNNPPVLVDSRGGKYFDGEVIKGAVHLSVKDTNENSLANLVPSKDKSIVFYCSNTACQASAFAAYKAAYAGYNTLYKYPGGIEDWKAKGHPTAKLN